MANRYSTTTTRRNPAASSLFDSYPDSRPSSAPIRAPTTPYTSQPLFARSSHNSPLPTHTKSNPYVSSAVLDHLEAQPDDQKASLLSSKVSQLKQLTIAIGDEIRDSSSLAETINTQFEGAGVKLKGTMRRMLRMAEKTGVGWRVWLGFFAVVWLLFVYVWLF